MISGLDWVFSQVESAIILEDDCLPQPSFFTFCEKMLARYSGDSRIGMVRGNNYTAPAPDDGIQLLLLANLSHLGLGHLAIGLAGL